MFRFILFLSLFGVLIDASGGGVTCTAGFDAAADGVPAIIVYCIGLLIMFFGIAIVTDEFFVPALQNLSWRMRLSEDVSGATLMASASSAPELFISIMGTFFSENSVGVGTVVGSAVFNILVIIACTGVFAPEELAIDWKPLARDVTFYICSILLLMTVIKFDGSEGVTEWYEGLSLFLFYLFYVLWMAFNETMTDATCGALENCIYPPDPEDDGDDDIETVDFSETPKTPTASDNKVQGLKLLRPKLLKFRHRYWAIAATEQQVVTHDDHAGAEDSDDGGDEKLIMKILNGMSQFLTNCWITIYEWTIPDCNIEDIEEKLSAEDLDDDAKASLSRERTRLQWWTLPSFGMCIFWIGLLCFGMTFCAEKFGCLVGISEVVMGLTILAAGTSVPDALASIAAAKQGQGNMGVANAIGSNVFDILIGLGLPWFLYGLIMGTPFVVNSDDVLEPLIILFMTVIITIAAFQLTGWKLGKMLGMILLAFYAAFCAYTFATDKGKPTVTPSPTLVQQG